MSVFGVILAHVFPHSDQNNSEYGHFSRGDHLYGSKTTMDQD